MMESACDGCAEFGAELGIEIVSPGGTLRPTMTDVISMHFTMRGVGTSGARVFGRECRACKRVAEVGAATAFQQGMVTGHVSATHLLLGTLSCPVRPLGWGS